MKIPDLNFTFRDSRKQKWKRYQRIQKDGGYTWRGQTGPTEKVLWLDWYCERIIHENGQGGVDTVDKDCILRTPFFCKGIYLEGSRLV